MGQRVNSHFENKYRLYSSITPKSKICWNGRAFCLAPLNLATKTTLKNSYFFILYVSTIIFFSKQGTRNTLLRLNQEHSKQVGSWDGPQFRSEPQVRFFCEISSSATRRGERGYSHGKRKDAQNAHVWVSSRWQGRGVRRSHLERLRPRGLEGQALRLRCPDRTSNLICWWRTPRHI